MVAPVGFRRHGHSEVDDPTITQPLLYKKIQVHPPLWRIYGKVIGLSEEEAIAMVVNGFIEPIAKELPLEYAIELNRLIQLEMEGSVG